MRNPPPGTLESVAEEISANSSSSSSRFSAPHRSSVSASEAECQQRCFATASGAFFLAFSGGLAVQVELARRLPPRLRGFTSFIPAAAAILASVESYRFLSTSCSMKKRIGSRSSFSSDSTAASAAARRRSSTSSSENNNASGNFPALLARRVSRLTTRQTNSSTNNSMECAAASSASCTVNSISPSTEERNLQQQSTQQQQQQEPAPSRPQIPVWNHITETPTAANNSDNSFIMIPALP